MTPRFKGVEYPDYEITESGEVISHKRGGTKSLKTFLNRKGYPEVTLCVNNKGANICVHKLVVHTFLTPDESKQIHHIDGDKTNNHLSNLQNVTAKENIVEFSKTGKHHAQKLTPEDVVAIRTRHDQGEPVYSISRTYISVSMSQVYRIAKRRQMVWVPELPITVLTFK